MCAEENHSLVFSELDVYWMFIVCSLQCPGANIKKERKKPFYLIAMIKLNIREIQRFKAFNSTVYFLVKKKQNSVVYLSVFLTFLSTDLFISSFCIRV